MTRKAMSRKIVGRGRMEERTLKASTSQGCVASTSDDGEIIVSEAVISFDGKKKFYDKWIMDSGAT